MNGDQEYNLAENSQQYPSWVSPTISSRMHEQYLGGLQGRHMKGERWIYLSLNWVNAVKQ